MKATAKQARELNRKERSLEKPRPLTLNMAALTDKDGSYLRNLGQFNQTTPRHSKTSTQSDLEQPKNKNSSPHNKVSRSFYMARPEGFEPPTP